MALQGKCICMHSIVHMQTLQGGGRKAEVLGLTVEPLGFIQVEQGEGLVTREWTSPKLCGNGQNSDSWRELFPS